MKNHKQPISAIDLFNKDEEAQKYFCMSNERELSSQDIILTILVNLFRVEVKRATNGVMIDFGCGPGTSFNKIASTIEFSQIIGVDGSVKMLEIAKEKILLPKTKLNFQLKNIENDKVEFESNTVDLALSCLTLKYLRKINNIFEEASRLLKIGSLFCCDIQTHVEPRSESLSFKNDFNVIEHYHSMFTVKVIAKNNGFDVSFYQNYISYWNKDLCSNINYGLFVFRKSV